jgi:hypothetical protein
MKHTLLALGALALSGCTLAEIQQGANGIEQAICAEQAMRGNPRLTLEEAIDGFCTGMQLIPWKEPADAARRAARSVRTGGGQ